MAKAISLVVAGETRKHDGTRRWGSTDTLRRKIKNNTLPAEKIGGKWFVDVADLDAVRDAADSDHALTAIRAAAKKAAKAAPPMSVERRKLVASILRGA